MSQSFMQLSGRALADLVRMGKLSLPEIVQEHLAALRQWNPSLNAIRWHNPDLLLQQAKDYQARLAKEPNLLQGRLLGSVLSIKDSIHVAGMPRSDGSIAGRKRQGGDVPSTHSAMTVQALQHEGALLLGKANMAEMGRSYFTDNPLFGRTNNPFDPSRSPGGSGGGDAAAIAVGMAKAGIGADSGGSIRVPAAFCGVFGFYPTPGTVPTLGMSGSNHTTRSLLRNHGPLAYHLDDLETLLAIMQQYHPEDPHSVAMPLGDRATKRKKIAFFTSMPGVRADALITAALHRAVKELAAQGYVVDELLPSCFEGALEPFVIIAGQAALVIDDMRAIAEGSPNDPSTEGPIMQRLRSRLAQHLPPLSAERLLDVWYQTNQLRYSAATFFQDYEFVLCPVTATLPPPHHAASYEVDGQSLTSEQVYRFASAVNILGLPALSCPVERSPQGLPIALQIVGARFADRDILTLARNLGLLRSLPL